MLIDLTQHLSSDEMIEANDLANLLITTVPDGTLNLIVLVAQCATVVGTLKSVPEKDRDLVKAIAICLINGGLQVEALPRS